MLFLVPLSHPYSMSRHILLLQIQWHKTDKQQPKQQSTAKMEKQRIKCFSEHFNVVHIFFSCDGKVDFCLLKMKMRFKIKHPKCILFHRLRISYVFGNLLRDKHSYGNTQQIPSR